MSAAAILTGLSWGMLLAGGGLAVWDGFREVPGLSRAVRIIDRGAWALLLITIPVGQKTGFPEQAQNLILMATAALSTLLGTQRRSSWSNARGVLPAVILTGVALFRGSASVGAEVGRDAVVMPVRWGILLCGSCGAAVLSAVLGDTVDWTPRVKRVSTITYALLTLLIAGVALVNLWQRGVAWAGIGGESGLLGAWLIWSAAWLGPRRRPRLRAALVVAAALSVIALAALI